ncbi:MAG TPA: hypothetical protein P5181_11165 [Dermatophilaceae bacterium]|nr:hypothetical protein [Dermatophilaceae bacterium]
MSQESDLDELTTQATAAYRAGRALFIARLRIGAWGSPGRGAIEAWMDSVEAIERAGWVLDEWSVGVDASGVPNAFPLFRRSDGATTGLRDSRT